MEYRLQITGRKMHPRIELAKAFLAMACDWVKAFSAFSSAEFVAVESLTALKLGRSIFPKA
ncbi:hypothetical protein D3C87_1687630 [compost metagenome]